LATVVGIRLLDRLRGAVLREQAARWESAGTLATTGDLAGAAGGFRPPPTAGRRLPAIGPRPLVLLYARRDAIAWLRSPERLAAGVLAGLVGAALLAVSTLLAGPTAWGAVVLGSAVLWGAGSAGADGRRHGIQTLGAPMLLGQTAALQGLPPARAPAVLLGSTATRRGGGGLRRDGRHQAASAARGGGGALLAAGGALELSGVPLPVLLALVLVAARARDAAKGPMPLSLMPPIPTPQGALSVLSVLVWQADALLLAVLAGAV